MALTRVWTPSPNYSGGGIKRLLVVHTMEGFTGPNGAYDCAAYFQGNVGASSQVCIDNYHAGKIWECVSRNNGAWTQCNYNTVSVSCEQSGYASWSRDYWLNNQSTLLHNTAQWLAEESSKFGIPLTVLTASQAQGGSKGVCHHRDLGSAGCGHSDCGSGYPLDKVIEWAKGGAPAPVTEDVDVSASGVIVNSVLHEACVWHDGRVNYQHDGITWYAVDKDASYKVKSGANICANYNTGLLVITATNMNGDVITYQKREDSGDKDWAKYNRGGDAK